MQTQTKTALAWLGAEQSWDLKKQNAIECACWVYITKRWLIGQTQRARVRQYIQWNSTFVRKRFFSVTRDLWMFSHISITTLIITTVIKDEIKPLSSAPFVKLFCKTSAAPSLEHVCCSYPNTKSDLERKVLSLNQIHFDQSTPSKTLAKSSVVLITQNVPRKGNNFSSGAATC